MIRFLILCIVFLLLYIGFNTISDYDLAINFTLLDYQVDTTLFAFITIFLITQLILTICFKLIFLVFNIPQILKNKWHRRKLRQINKKLLAAIAELMMGNRSKSITLTNKSVSGLDKQNKEVINLILAETQKKSDKKIQYLKNLLNKKHYSIYSAKELAKIYHKNMHHKQAEEYALKAFNENDTDTETMIMLIRIYASLGFWPKLIFIVSKLQRADAELLKKYSKEIADYYLAAAKFYLKSESNDECLNYLDSVLTLQPDHIEALNLFIKLSISKQNTVAILKKLKTAFLSRPCFEIAKIYIANSSNSKDSAYDTLAKLVEPKKYPDLFLALAVYLDLPDKIAEIKKLI